MSKKLPVTVVFLTSETRGGKYYLFVAIKKYARRKWQLYLIAQVDEEEREKYKEIIRTQALEEGSGTPEFLSLESFTKENDLEEYREVKLTPDKYENYKALERKIKEVIIRDIL